MKKLLLGLALILPAITFSQIDFSNEYDVELSRPYDVVDAAVKEYFSVKGGSEILSVKASNAGVTISRFDVEDMREIKRKQTTDFPKYTKFIDVVYISDELFYYIYEVYSKSTKSFTVYKRDIRVESVGLGGMDKLFVTSKPVTTDRGRSFASMSGSDLNWAGMPEKPHFYVKTSFDKSKVLISYRLKPKYKDDKKNYDVIGMHVFDNNMESVWGDEVKMPYTESVMNNLAYGVGNRGHALVLLQKTSDKTLEMLGFNEGEIVHFDIDVETDILFQSFEIHETPEGNFLFSGLYANGIDIKVNWTGNVSAHFNSDGLFNFTLNSDGELIANNKIPFELDFIGEYLSDRQRKKLAAREEDGKAGISDLRIVNVHINEDGSKVFLCERQWYDKVMKGTSTKWVYFYGNMVAMKIDAEGELEWISKLPKQQEGLTGLGGMSFKYIHGKDKHLVVYVDNAKNAQLPPDVVPARHTDGRGGILTAYIVDDESGSVDKHLIFDVDDLNGKEIYQFKVSRIFEAFPGTFFTEVYLKKKMDGMIKMSAR